MINVSFVLLFCIASSQYLLAAFQQTDEDVADNTNIHVSTEQKLQVNLSLTDWLTSLPTETHPNRKWRTDLFVPAVMIDHRTSAEKLWSASTEIGRNRPLKFFHPKINEPSAFRTFWNWQSNDISLRAPQFSDGTLYTMTSGSFYLNHLQFNLMFFHLKDRLST